MQYFEKTRPVTSAGVLISTPVGAGLETTGWFLHLHDRLVSVVPGRRWRPLWQLVESRGRGAEARVAVSELRA